MANEFKVKNGVKFPDGTTQTTAGVTQLKTLNGTSLQGIGDIEIPNKFPFYKSDGSPNGVALISNSYLPFYDSAVSQKYIYLPRT